MVATSITSKHYKGRIDDISDVTLSLYCDGQYCDGEMTYLRSRDQFRLEGVRKADNLQLKEMDKSGNGTGFLSGKVQGNTLLLDWKNKSGTIGNMMVLTEVDKKPIFPTFCGDNKWINVYRGEIKGQEVEMILQRVDNNRVLGQAFFVNTGQKITVSGEMTLNDNLYLSLTEEKTGNPIGLLRGVFRQKHNLNASYYSNANIQSFATFNLEKSLSVSCLEYTDFYTTYEFLFPKSNNAIFNEIMVVLTKDWIDECRTHSKNIRKKKPDADLRASQRAYSWTDIEILTDQFISGLLTYHTSWSGLQKTKTFNYDFTSGELIDLPGIFKKGFDYESFIKEYISEEITKTQLYKNNRAFRNWIRKQEFPHFTFDQTGISFYTEFHIVYDRQRVLVPYKKLKGYIRKNAAVRSLF